MPESFGRLPIGLKTFEAMTASPPPTLQRLAQHRLRHAADIGIGGVEEIDAGIECRADHAARLVLVGAVAEGHGAEADLRNLKSDSYRAACTAFERPPTL